MPSINDEYFITKTKELIDHTLSKIPGSAYRDVHIMVSWQSVAQTKTQESKSYIGEEKFIITPVVQFSWGEGTDPK